MADSKHPPGKTPATAPPRPTITPPPRNQMEALFNGGGGGGSAGFSPGPMTLVSSFFSESDECKSFSQLLAGAMTSPAAGRSSGDVGGDLGFRPTGLVMAPPSPMFMVPPGLSPAALFESQGGLFSPGQGPYGLSHQQALAQVTAQAVQAHSQMHIQGGYTSSLPGPPASSTRIPTFATTASTNQQTIPVFPDSRVTVKETSEFSRSDRISQSSAAMTVDKPADDGYRWRKYGQKIVKGSEFPRSYYKCTHPSCPVTKKVERSLDGQVTEIIYKGQHNHQPPQANKRAKDAGILNGNSSNHGEHGSHAHSGNLSNMSRRDHESSQATAEHLSGTSDSEEVGGSESGIDGRDEDERKPKRQIVEAGVSEPASLHRTVTEPRIIVQTTSEVDLLDDGYRWRKYGQKVVKGNPYPRSYYKCTTPGCNVRKHIERASADPKAVITTYEGKHNHDVPAAKSSSHNTAGSNASQLKHNQALMNNSYLRTNNQEVAHLRLKEEQIT